MIRDVLACILEELKSSLKGVDSIVGLMLSAMAKVCLTLMLCFALMQCYPVTGHFVFLCSVLLSWMP